MAVEVYVGQGEKPTILDILEEYYGEVIRPYPVIIDEASGMQLVVIDLSGANADDSVSTGTCSGCAAEGLPVQVGTTVDVVPNRADVGYRYDHHAHSVCDGCGTITSVLGIVQTFRGRLLGFAERRLNISSAPPAEKLFEPNA